MPYQHVVADLAQLGLHFLSVLLHHLKLLIATIRLLLDARDDPPRRSSGPDHVFVGDREQVPLLVGELGSLLSHCFHGRRHVVVALGLLRQLGLLDQLRFIHAVSAKRVYGSPIKESESGRSKGLLDGSGKWKASW